MKVINWLLESQPYVEYATRVSILKQNKSSLNELRNLVLLDSRIKRYLNDIADFNSILVTNHKNPELPIHKLIFLLDVGLDTDVPEIDMAIKQIIKNRDEYGMYKSMTNIPKHFGGSGEDTLAWSLCDAPLMLYALLKAGISYENNIKKGVEYIGALQRDNGFPCTVSNELGKFRGPGKKDDCCPYATLIILKLLSLIPEYANSELVTIGINQLLKLWENSKALHPYMFYMGTDFRKLKAPTLWYDIISISDCLSYFEFAKKDKRFQEILDVIESKANQNNQFTPESIYQKCKDWDFGQKKQPSSWLTFLCLRILERSGRVSFD
ncbi:hypothetical protein [Pseudobacteroides cellulosolvens]|uniref:Uncharacterized protein n=1 Tax=Pseudobacteroides cellulosolvens ATCC 35603 = DSM 2933 TaxID=398512 RepID=A0A0L6JPB1_9FIRM|nr:hypothetical protein [Pseudobacteroides cellulosolvens]KNY27623.1 hypothetical protein Bccel_2894 [Pseudobacteroides cellulosolvens ATCC 35603 = DSM 2933]